MKNQIALGNQAAKHFSIGRAFGVAALFFSFAQAQGSTIIGDIKNDGPASPIMLLLKSTSQPVQISASPPLIQYLRKLRTGDEVTVQGTFVGGRINIASVDRVGLQELLGTWRSSRWEIFEFQDFSQLNLYVTTPGHQNGSVSLSKTQSLRYVVTPEQDNRYSIFMSDDSNVRMGFLEVQANKLTLSVTDFKTGQVTENISLSPVRLQ